MVKLWSSKPRSGVRFPLLLFHLQFYIKNLNSSVSNYTSKFRSGPAAAPRLIATPTFKFIRYLVVSLFFKLVDKPLLTLSKVDLGLLKNLVSREIRHLNTLRQILCFCFDSCRRRRPSLPELYSINFPPMRSTFNPTSVNLTRWRFYRRTFMSNRATNINTPLLRSSLTDSPLVFNLASIGSIMSLVGAPACPSMVNTKVTLYPYRNVFRSEFNLSRGFFATFTKSLFSNSLGFLAHRFASRHNFILPDVHHSTTSQYSKYFASSISAIVSPLLLSFLGSRSTFLVNFSFTNALSRFELGLVSSVKSRLQHLHPSLSNIIFVSEFLNILYFTLLSRDFQSLRDYVRRIFSRLSV